MILVPFKECLTSPELQILQLSKAGVYLRSCFSRWGKRYNISPESHSVCGVMILIKHLYQLFQCFRHYSWQQHLTCFLSFNSQWDSKNLYLHFLVFISHGQLCIQTWFWLPCYYTVLRGFCLPSHCLFALFLSVPYKLAFPCLLWVDCLGSCATCCVKPWEDCSTSRCGSLLRQFLCLCWYATDTGFLVLINASVLQFLSPCPVPRGRLEVSSCHPSQYPELLPGGMGHARTATHLLFWSLLEHSKVSRPLAARRIQLDRHGGTVCVQWAGLVQSHTHLCRPWALSHMERNRCGTIQPSLKCMQRITPQKKKKKSIKCLFSSFFHQKSRQSPKWRKHEERAFKKEGSSEKWPREEYWFCFVLLGEG